MVYKKVIGCILSTALLLSGVFAIANNEKNNGFEKTLQNPEWLYMGGDDPLDETQYELNESSESLAEICSSGTTVCGVIAPANGNHPDLSDPGLKSRIQNPGTYSDVFFQPAK